MVVRMRSYLYAAGVDVPNEVMKAGLFCLQTEGICTLGISTLIGLLTLLSDAVLHALKDGYQGCGRAVI